MIDYTKILSRKFKGQEWSLNGDDYEGLEWLSDTPKPTKAELDALWDQLQTDILAEAEAKVQAKSQLLERLGITADEAKLLLA